MADLTRPSIPVPQVPPLVGRDREQATLREALASALAGRGSLVLIGGEAGIGKTALAEALLHEAEQDGALAIVGRCYDLTETPPYGPWAEALARTPRGDALPAPPDLGGAGVASQAAIFAAVRDALAALAARQPLLLVLEDLHWADPASLDLLRFLARGLAEVPTLILATYRAGELPRRHPLSALLPLLVRESGALRLDLHPLADAALRTLLRQRYALSADDEGRLARYLHAHAEGNPLFIGELLRALEEARTLVPGDDGWHLGDPAGTRVPTLLRQVIEARLSRLGAESEHLLSLAAVVGQVVSLPVWATVAETDEGTLLATVERASGARVADETPDGTGMRFAHALIRETLYEGLPPSRRRAIHRQLGEALAAGPAPDPDATASHFQRAGDPRAVGWLVRAGERAHRAYAWLSAAARFEAALTLMDARGDDAGERGWLHFRLARLYRRADPARGLRHLEEAAAMATAHGDRALAACILSTRGQLRATLRDIRGGLADMAAGIAALDALPAADRVALAGVSVSWLVDTLSPAARDVPAGAGVREAWLGVLVLRLGSVGRHDEALALGAEVAARTADAESSDLLAFTACADAHFGLGFAHAARGRPGEAHVAFQRTRRHYRALEHYEAVTAATNRELDSVVLPYQADHLVERRALTSEASSAYARSSGIRGGQSEHQPLLPFLVLEGHWDEARTLDTGGPFHLNWQGLLAHGRGDVALAQQVVQEMLPEGHATEPGGALLLPALALQRLAATLALDVGDLPLARDWLAAHDRWLAWSGATLGQADAQLSWAAYHRAAGDLALAYEHAERALAHASEPRQPLALLAAHRLLGELDTAASRLADAQLHLDAALALAEACAAPYERALTLLALAELQATADRDEAGITLAQARTILAPLGAAPALARAAALAARLVAAPTPAALPFGLTAREAEVLRLLAAGLTDPQIAARLSISRNTVNAHLRAIYGKLGVNTRAAATAAASDHGLR